MEGDDIADGPRVNQTGDHNIYGTTASDQGEYNEGDGAAGTTNGVGNEESSSPASREQLWVEIRCNVFSAEIVKNVSF